MNAIVEWAEQIAPLVSDLIDQPDPEFGCDCFWVHFHPYRRILSANTKSFIAGIVVRNHHTHEASLKLTPAVPAGWSSSPISMETTLAAKSESTFEFEVAVSDLSSGQRHVLATDVVLDNTDHGELAEMIIDIE